MSMVVLKLDEKCDFFTLCFAGDQEIKPLTDFDSLEQAELIMHKINRSGYAIQLTEPSSIREFSVGKLVSGEFIAHHTTANLKQALALIDVKVDFDVEAPAPEFGFFADC